jgi:hypothetical protein
VSILDLALVELKPTWVNNRIGEATMSKILDMFIMHIDLCGQVERFQTWVGKTRCSDHFLIVLELDEARDKPKAPFKFNHALDSGRRVQDFGLHALEII